MGNTKITVLGLGAEEEEQEVSAVVAQREDGRLEEEKEQEDVDGGGAEEAKGEGEVEEEAEAMLQCSICLDAMVAGGEGRSTVRLQCSHEFHLDCIGSAFNAKGIMQCPNCRQIEKGNWLYANGPSSSEDVIDDWVLDEDLDDSALPEVATFVPVRFYWFPISRLSELPSLFDEMEPSTPSAFHDYIGQNFNDELMSLSESGTTNQRAYIAYMQPLPPSVPSSSPNIVERTVDGSADHYHQNPLSGPSDGQPLQTAHTMDFHHLAQPIVNHREDMRQSYSQSDNNNGVAEQPGLPVGATRIVGADSDHQQRGSFTSFFANEFGRPRNPGVPPMAPQFINAPGNIDEQLHHSSSDLFAGSQPSGDMRPLGAGRSAVPPRDNTFYLFPPDSSRSSVEATEDIEGRFYSWEQEHFGPH